MTTFVRVRDTRTGHEVDISVRAVRDHHEVLPGFDRVSKPRPPVHATPAAPKKPAASRQATAQPTSTDTKES